MRRKISTAERQVIECGLAFAGCCRRCRTKNPVYKRYLLSAAKNATLVALSAATSEASTKCISGTDLTQLEEKKWMVLRKARQVQQHLMVLSIRINIII